MTFSKPGYLIPRRSVVGHEGEWVKSFDPPKESPPTPELLKPTNPVPAFVAANVPGATMLIANTARVHLMHAQRYQNVGWEKIRILSYWKSRCTRGRNGTFPGPTIRVPAELFSTGK